MKMTCPGLLPASMTGLAATGPEDREAVFLRQLAGATTDALEGVVR